MKKVIALFVILAVLLSSVSCKKTKDDEVGYADVDYGTKPQQDSEQSKTPTIQKEQNQTSEQQAHDTETDLVSKEAASQKQEQHLNFNEEMRKNLWVGNYFSQDVYVSEYLPLKSGYVTKEYNNYGNFYYTAENDFATREPITEKMIEAAKKYPYKEVYDSYISDEFRIGAPTDYKPECYMSRSVEFPAHNPKDYDSMLDCLEAYLDDDTFIVRGHFEQGYGIAYAEYTVDSEKSRFNYKINPYTIYNFVIDKVYDENCRYKAGDIVEVGLGGTILQNYDGFYCGMYKGYWTTSPQSYTNFNEKTLKERTYVLSLKPPSKENRPDVFTVDHICQNVYDTEAVYDFDEYHIKITAKEILEKYN